MDVLNNFRGLSPTLDNGIDLLTGTAMHEGGQAAYRVALRGPHFTLRHYTPEGQPCEGQPLLLVPAMMARAEVYDLAPESSAVRLLCEAGRDVWVVDFGDPETEPGGMERTLDDYLGAINGSIGYIHSAVGQDVHVAAYSQSGMLVYQVAAYRRGEGIASIIAFGSMCDVHKNVFPSYWDQDRAARNYENWFAPMMALTGQSTRGISGPVVTRMFAAASWQKRVMSTAKLVTSLGDRDYLARTEPLRRFLGGEGFLGWAGPALRDWMEEFVIHNRLMTGGFQVLGERHSLDALELPILSVIGTHDLLAQPASVRAIGVAAPHCQVFEHEVPSGHFGMVVGSVAFSQTWPKVLQWCRWREDSVSEPEGLVPCGAPAAQHS